MDLDGASSAAGTPVATGACRDPALSPALNAGMLEADGGSVPRMEPSAEL